MQAAAAGCGSVDWAAQSHAACMVEAAGQVIDQFTVDHTALGLTTLVRRFQQRRVHRVAIERPDGPVVVVSSRAVKALRTRYGVAANKADGSDADVLADCLRTAGRPCSPIRPRPRPYAPICRSPCWSGSLRKGAHRAAGARCGVWIRPPASPPEWVFQKPTRPHRCWPEAGVLRALGG
jgi:hypothetical protein